MTNIVIAQNSASKVRDHTQIISFHFSQDFLAAGRNVARRKHYCFRPTANRYKLKSPSSPGHPWKRNPDRTRLPLVLLHEGKQLDAHERSSPEPAKTATHPNDPEVKQRAHDINNLYMRFVQASQT